MKRLLPSFVVSALLAHGCAGPTGPAVQGSAAPARPKATPSALAPPGPGGVKRLGLEADRRPVGLRSVTVTITGKVQLLSDQGAGVISNNSGAIISDNGGGLIGNNAGSYRLIFAAGAAAATRDGGPRPENPLAEADIELLDGRGRLVSDDEGRPLGIRTDNDGNFKFEGRLPPEALVARVRLWQGGVLMAMLAPQRADGKLSLDLDTASTLGAAYVLEKFVQKRQDVYDRLPAAEAEGLRRDVEAARGALPATPTYAPATLLAAAEALKAQAPAVDQRLERIRAILLVGQADAGNGRAAREVSLSFPMSIAPDGAGGLLVGEFAGGRVRHVDAAGVIRRYMGGGLGTQIEGPLAEVAVDSPSGMCRAPDGTVYVADELGARIVAIKDGQARPVAGTGVRGQGAGGGPGTSVAISRPVALAAGPDGTVWIGENTRSQDTAGRLLRLDRDGTLHVEALPDPSMEIPGIAVTADETLWVADNSASAIWLRPKGGAWRKVAAGLDFDAYGRMLALPDGRVALAEDNKARVLALHADGKVDVLAGDGTPGFQGDGGPASAARFATPCGMMLADDGALLVADSGNGLIRRLALPLDGTGLVSTVAGTFGVSQQGDALSIAINTPGGMAFDAQGRLLFTEGAGHTLKRLENGRLTVLAGRTSGDSGDGGPATAAQMNGPTGVAVIGDAIYVLDAINTKVRKIDAAGIITTVAGSGKRGKLNPGPQPALAVNMRQLLGCAAAPDGRLYWSDAENSQIGRLNLDGTVELVAGANTDGGDAGDGGPAAAAHLNQPSGLAFDAKGDLYFGDAANMRIRKITGLAGATPMIEAVAGIPGFAALFEAGDQAGELPGDKAALVAPSGLAFGPDGALYVAELGTGRLKTLLGARGLTVAELPPSPARIRRITGLAAGKPLVKTIAGPGTELLAQPGTDDSLVLPVGLIYDDQRGLFVMDTGNNAIRLLPKGAL